MRKKCQMGTELLIKESSNMPIEGLGDQQITHLCYSSFNS